uniref:Herpes_Helicase domain-containing protein n=1 Tax=Steinernema glaseri TaxID=37863 RepID=A0A1I8AB02_9BILA
MQQGLCNGTMLQVTRMSDELIVCRRTDDSPLYNEIVHLPRVLFRFDGSTKYPPFERIQFPIRVAFANTISKAQGQTLRKVALCFSNGEVFAHGQLYVALSRVKRAEDLCFYSTQSPIEHALKNVVLEELIREDPVPTAPPPLPTTTRRLPGASLHDALLKNCDSGLQRQAAQSGRRPSKWGVTMGFLESFEKLMQDRSAARQAAPPPPPAPRPAVRFTEGLHFPADYPYRQEHEVPDVSQVLHEFTGLFPLSQLAVLRHLMLRIEQLNLIPGSRPTAVLHPALYDLDDPVPAHLLHEYVYLRRGHFRMAVAPILLRTEDVNNHWALAMLNMDTHSVVIYDSSNLCAVAPGIIRRSQDIVTALLHHHQGLCVPPQNVTVVFADGQCSTMPPDDNSGVFLLHNAIRYVELTNRLPSDTSPGRLDIRMATLTPEELLRLRQSYREELLEHFAVEAARFMDSQP